MNRRTERRVADEPQITAGESRSTMEWIEVTIISSLAIASAAAFLAGLFRLACMIVDL